MWTIVGSEITIIYSYNIDYKTNFHTETSGCVCVVIDAYGYPIFHQQSKQDKTFLCACI